MLRRYAIIWSLILGACASPPAHKSYPVLEPMDPPGAVAENVVNPRYAKLEGLLLSLGYEPVGMQFESDANLDVLYQVFSNPIAQQRKIKLVYTGIQIAYDKGAESLTIGGMTNITSILTYIQRNVPINKGPVTPIQPIAPKVRPSPTPVPPLNRVIPSPSPVPTPSQPDIAPFAMPPPTAAPELIPEEEIPVE